MKMLAWTGVLAALVAIASPLPAWALRCGTQVVQQGETAAQVRDACGAPFFKDRYVGPPGAGVDALSGVAPAVTREAWYYNFGPQRLMMRLDFSGGVLARVRTLGYGFVGSGGPCDPASITVGMSVADLIGRCGLPASRARNPLATAAAMGEEAPAWGETWTYPGEGSGVAREVRLQDGWVVDVQGVR